MLILKKFFNLCTIYHFLLLFNLIETSNIDIKSDQLFLKNLLKNYNKKIRPSDKVNIRFSLVLNQIVEIIENQQILVLNVYLDHKWIDHRLKWNPKEFKNTSLLRINSDFLWTYVYI
jgi:hypothetical protein